MGCTEVEQYQTPSETSAPEKVDGWIEATAIVRSVEKQKAFFTEIAGYDVIFEGETPPALLEAWGLSQSVTGREVLLKETSESRGFIRLVELFNAPNQIEARSSASFIDSGGVMGLNVRVTDIQASFDALQAAGWRALSDPVSFSVEGFSVAEAVFLGPDGLVIGLIERRKPALGAEWKMKLGELSRPNNAFVITANIDEASNYYRQSMGWKRVLEDRVDQAAQPGMNIYGWPHNLAESVKRHVVWFHPTEEASRREGTIALIALKGASGRDFSEVTRPPNFGWVSLRTWSETTEELQLPHGASFELFPYGCVILSITRDHDGTQIEHLRPSKTCEE